MRSDCIACLVERTKYECDMIFKHDDEKIGAMEEVLLFLLSHLKEEGRTPAFFGTERERILKRRSGLMDPHEAVKRRSNEVAKELLHVAIHYYASLHHDGDSGDSGGGGGGEDRGDGDEALSDIEAEALVRIAAAANSMEYGVKGYSYDDAAFKADFVRILNEKLNWDRDRVITTLRERDRILYLTDNAGEVFFDAFVVMKLREMGKEVVVSPKSGAVINDATVNDWREAADYLALPVDVRMVPSGAAIGVSLEDANPEFIRIFNDEDYLVIAKGMGNYESISEFESELKQRVLYILRAKCIPVAESIGVKRGELVAKISG